MTIEIVGGRELRADLKRFDKEAPAAVSALHKRIALLHVGAMKSAASQRPRKEKTGHVAPHIRASGTRTAASIKVSASKVPDIYVQEFGGKIPLFGDRSRKVTVRPRKADGYFIYPTIEAKRRTTISIYEDALNNSIRRHFD